MPLDDLEGAIEKLMWDDKIVSVYTTRLLWTTPQNYPIFSTLYARDCEEIIDFSGIKKVEDIAKENGLKVQEVREILRCMEKAYLVGRKIKGRDTYWYRREPIGMERTYALEMLIKNLLYFRAPLTFEEIVYALHLPEGDIRRVLKYLVEEGTVVKGVFLVGYGEQYMLRDDYENLKASLGMKEDKLQEYRYSKIVKPMSLDEYFDNFLVAFHEDSLRARGAYEEFLESLRKGDVLYGRFMRRKLCYASKDTIPLLIAAYRREELGEKDKKILYQIGVLGKRATYSKIKEISNMYPHEVKRIIEKLENNLYIYRKILPHKSPQTYHFGIMKLEPQGTIEEFITRIVKGYGPITRKDIENLTGIDPKDYLGKFKKISAGGRIFYYVEEKIEGEAKGRCILPSTDPFIYPRLNEIYDKLGEVLEHVYVKDGKIEGTLEFRRYADYIFVKETIGDRKGIYDILRSEGIVVTQENPESSGYERVGDYFVHGEISREIIPMEKMIKYLLWKNRVISGRKLKTTLDVAKLLMGLHNDMENVRAYRPIEVMKYFKSELLYETVDLKGHVIYALPEHISIFQAIRDEPLDGDMETVLRILDKYRKMEIRNIIEESPLGRERTSRALEMLYRGNYIAKYPGGYIYIERKYSREYAIEKFVENMVNALGIISPEIISIFSGSHINPMETVEILDGMSLLKGIFLNDGKLYRIPREDIENMEFIEVYDDIIILPPNDPLNAIIESLQSSEFSGYMVIKGGKLLGIVKATLRRKGAKIQKYTNEEAKNAFLAYMG